MEVVEDEVWEEEVAENQLPVEAGRLPEEAGRLPEEAGQHLAMVVRPQVGAGLHLVVGDPHPPMVVGGRR